MRTFALLGLTLVLAVPVHAKGGAAAQARDVEALLEGVHRIAMPGVPGTLSVFGPDAFPVIAGTSGGRPAPLVAATRLGRGRAVLFGHTYFEGALKEGDTARLVENVAAWVADKPKGKAVIGVRAWKALVPLLEQAGFRVVFLEPADWHEHLKGLDALFVPLAEITDAQREILGKRVAAGLGVVAGMPGWGWQQLNPKRRLAEDNQANQLLAPAGLVWGGETLEKPAGGLLEVAGPAPELTHAGRALEALLDHERKRRTLSAEEGALAVATVTRAIREVPEGDDLLLPRLDKLMKHAEDPRFLPSAKSPITDKDGLGKLLLTLQIQRDGRRAPGKLEAHPAAAVFPGAVERKAERIKRDVAVDTHVPGWTSTGLYAAPGEVVRVRVPKAAVDAGLALRIGAHKDKLWGNAAWRRAPEITVERPIQAETSEHACAFGGLVYVVVPRDCKLGEIEVTVAGAVAAPHFHLGVHTLEDWRETLRQYPAPWAELETSKVILTVPSEFVRALDDPEALLRWWDGVMDGCADLATIPHERERPERYVTDEQISNGYMHAGYPIMAHLDAAPRFVDLPTLSTKGDWGMFHEMGHNHQHRDWTFDGTVEVTCNLFSLYLMETVCSKGIGHEAMAPESIAKHRAAFQKGGAQFGLWQSQPFTALIMYYELKREFGWEAYKQAFAEYRDLPAGSRPKNDAEKRNQWLVRMSKTVGRNLGPFFQAWGIPVSKQALSQVGELPVWMPKD